MYNLRVIFIKFFVIIVVYQFTKNKKRMPLNNN